MTGKSPLWATGEQRADLTALAGSRDRSEADRARAVLLTLAGWTSHTSPTKRSSDFVAHLDQLDRLYGPRPGQPVKPVVLVEDNGPIHTSRLSRAALAARAHWLTVEWLPKYAPELNDIEIVWHDLKAHHLAHQTFADSDALDRAIHQAVDDLNDERIALPLAEPRISA
jgi:transposase